MLAKTRRTYMQNNKPLWFGQTKRWYDSNRWRRVASAHKNQYPLCEICLKLGIERPVAVTDHIIPHNGDYALFWDWDNLQSLCATCHGLKRAVEHGGHMPGCDVDGNPLDDSHWWNKT